MDRHLTPKRFYYVLVACMVLLCAIALAGAVAGNHLMSSHNKKLMDLKLEEKVLEEQKIALAQAKADLERYAELEQIAKQIVPQEKDQVRTVREIVGFAVQAGVPLASISFPGSELGEGGDIKLTQLEPVDGLKNVYKLEITVTNGPNPTSFNQLVRFLSRLESNRRTSQVTTIDIVPSMDNRNLLTFVITLNVYIKPEGGE